MSVFRISKKTRFSLLLNFAALFIPPVISPGFIPLGLLQEVLYRFLPEITYE